MGQVDFHQMRTFSKEVISERRLRMSPWAVPPEPLGRRLNLHYFFLNYDNFAWMPWMVKPYSRRQLTREERIAKYRISRGRMVVENALESRFRALMGTMEQSQRLSEIFARYLNVPYHQNLWETSKVSQMSKIKRSNPKVRILSPNVKSFFKSKCFHFCLFYFEEGQSFIAFTRFLGGGQSIYFKFLIQNFIF